MLLGGIAIGALCVFAASARAGAQDQPPLTLAPVGRRASPPQPQQKPGVEYLAGTWNLVWTGRESPITVGPRTGTVVFARQGAGNVLSMTGDGKTDAGAPYKETGTFEWDETKKALSIKERLSVGTEIQGTGDWSSPLSIRFESAPIQLQVDGKAQTLKLRRTYSILSAVSFSVAEELSTNGGPFQRLGTGQYVRR
jgi:hypothetical protein